MISITDIIIETSQPKEKDERLEDMLKDSTVQRFVELSKRKLMGNMDHHESKIYQNLFDDPKVKSYLEAAQQVGRRNGWLVGAPLGVVAGAVASSIVVPAMAILGAALGGITVGYIFSKVNEILSKWKAEDNVTTHSKSVNIVGM